MPTPLEICLEEMQLPPDDERYIRCVAIPGSAPGLALDREGVVRWMPEAPADYGLWVSADDRLILQRAQGAGPITVRRAGRAIEAPRAKPVVLLDQDLLELDGRQLRVHVHGVTDRVHPPERLSGSALARTARATVAALALGAAVGAPSSGAAGPYAGNPPPIEVRAQPPDVAPAPRPVVCDITSLTPGKKGPTIVRALCPAGSVPPVGSQGQLQTAGGALVPDGWVVVKQVVNRTIVGETKLRAPRATKIRFVR